MSTSNKRDRPVYFDEAHVKKVLCVNEGLDQIERYVVEITRIQRY